MNDPQLVRHTTHRECQAGDDGPGNPGFTGESGQMYKLGPDLTGRERHG
jgi:hypothetical protein